MKQIECPRNGLRNIDEFTFVGEYHSDNKNINKQSPKELAEKIFFKNNTTGVVTELWRHNPSSYWFLLERNRLTDVIMKTFPLVKGENINE